MLKVVTSQLERRKHVLEIFMKIPFAMISSCVFTVMAMWYRHKQDWQNAWYFLFLAVIMANLTGR